MPDGNLVVLGYARRIALLSVASLLLTGCAVLTLALNAVPKSQLALVAAAAVYIQVAHLLQRKKQPAKLRSNVIRPLANANSLRKSTIRVFLIISLVISIIIPWVWLLAFSPTPAQCRLLGPPLFVMMSQVLFEIWSYQTTVSILFRITIPVGFVSYRLRLLIEWVQEAAKLDVNNTADQLMFVLACVNLFFWAIMLFYVLLLKVCPPYFNSPIDNAHQNGQLQQQRSCPS